MMTQSDDVIKGMMLHDVNMVNYHYCTDSVINRQRHKRMIAS